MARWLGWGMGCALLATQGCTTVKVVQRDGCWVRQTKGFLNIYREEIGPCARREPKWSEDRLARLVQECVAEADYRWETEALAAWNKGQPLPAQAPEQATMRSCMENSATSVLAENERLQKRLAELSSEREELQKNASQHWEHLRANQERMTDALGEAAKKPAPSAFATANSTGTASSETEQRAQPAVPISVSTPAEKSPPGASCSPTGKRRANGGKETGALCAPPHPSLFPGSSK